MFTKQQTVTLDAKGTEISVDDKIQSAPRWPSTHWICNMVGISLNMPYYIYLKASTIKKIGSDMPFVVYTFFMPNVHGEDGYEPGTFMPMVGSKVLVYRMLGTIISVPFWVWLSTYIGKFRSALIGNSLRSLSLLLAGFTVWYNSPIEFFIYNQFLSGLSSGSNALVSPIINEVIDYDSFLSGKKREAMFKAEVQYMWKLVRLPSEVLPFVRTHSSTLIFILHLDSRSNLYLNLIDPLDYAYPQPYAHDFFLR